MDKLCIMARYNGIYLCNTIVALYAQQKSCKRIILVIPLSCFRVYNCCDNAEGTHKLLYIRRCGNGDRRFISRAKKASRCLNFFILTVQSTRKIFYATAQPVNKLLQTRLSPYLDYLLKCICLLPGDYLKGYSVQSPSLVPLFYLLFLLCHPNALK